MTPALAAALVAGGYLAGSIPFGVLLTRLFTGADVRKVGSGNIGASNVTRAAGKAAGVLTLVLDAAKASLPMLAVRAALRDQGEHVALAGTTLVGVAAFVGHLYPVWLRFRGGKGVATGLGVFLVLTPWASLAALAGFALAFAVTRVPAVGSLVGTAIVAAGTFLRYGAASAVSWAGLAVALVILFRHRSNIDRLLRGSENKV